MRNTDLEKQKVEAFKTWVLDKVKMEFFARKGGTFLPQVHFLTMHENGQIFAQIKAPIPDSQMQEMFSYRNGSGKDFLARNTIPRMIEMFYANQVIVLSVAFTSDVWISSRNIGRDASEELKQQVKEEMRKQTPEHDPDHLECLMTIFDFNEDPGLMVTIPYDRISGGIRFQEQVIGVDKETTDIEGRFTNMLKKTYAKLKIK